MLRSTILLTISLCVCFFGPEVFAQSSRLATLVSFDDQGLSQAVLNVSASLGRLTWNYRAPLYVESRPRDAILQTRYDGENFTATATVGAQGFKKGQLKARFDLEALLLQGQAEATFTSVGFKDGGGQFRVGRPSLNVRGQLDVSSTDFEGFQLASRYQIGGADSVLSGAAQFDPLRFQQGKLQYQATRDSVKLVALGAFDTDGISKEQLKLSTSIDGLFNASGVVALMNTGSTEGQLELNGTWSESFVSATVTFRSLRFRGLLVSITTTKLPYTLTTQVQLNASTGFSWADLEASVDVAQFELVIAISIGSVGFEEGKLELGTSIGNVSIRNETVFSPTQLQNSQFRLGISF